MSPYSSTHKSNGQNRSHIPSLPSLSPFRRLLKKSTQPLHRKVTKFPADFQTFRPLFSAFSGPDGEAPNAPLAKTVCHAGRNPARICQRRPTPSGRGGKKAENIPRHVENANALCPQPRRLTLPLRSRRRDGESCPSPRRRGEAEIMSNQADQPAPPRPAAGLDSRRPPSRWSADTAVGP